MTRITTPMNRHVALVVDDDRTLRVLAREALEQAGYAVEEAADGAQALTACAHLRPNIVLLDVDLPKVDGFTVCAALRRMPSGDRTPVLMMTALDDIDSINRAYEVGATDFITKPVNWVILSHRVRYMIRASHTLEALRVSEAHLVQSQKMQALGDLAGGIANDFNNLLSVILGYAEVATQEVPQGSKVWGRLQEILTAGHQARDLVRQILAFSRRSKPERKLVQLHLLVKEALTLLRASFPSTIDIRQDLSAGAGGVLADPTQMHQVLMNLCCNAEHAMRETGGVLDVRLDTVEVDAALVAGHPELKPGPHVRLTVRDAGHGMTPDIVERIFEPFFTTKAVGEGTGMGLAVTHGIIANHGGAITVTTAPGCGTTFQVYLPQVDGAAAEDAGPEAPASVGTERILFVDDEAAIAELGQEMLEPLGYRCVACTSGEQALDAFRTAPQGFDLAITDQTMPKMTGEALIRELRSIRPDLPIILCTGYSHTMTAEKAQTLEIDAYLLKPLLAADLDRAIRSVLEQRKLRPRQPGSRKGPD